MTAEMAPQLTFPTETRPPLHWIRRETGFNADQRVSFSSGSRRPFVYLRQATIGQHPIIDSSIRIPSRREAFVLRYDFDGTDGYQDWEFIQTVRSRNPNGGAMIESVTFKQNRVDDPTFVVPDALAPSWQMVLARARAIIESLPANYPERSVLQTIWQDVAVIGQTAYNEEVERQRTQAQEQIAASEKEQILHAFPPTRPSVIRQTLNTLASRLRPGGNGNRLQPNTSSLDS